MTLVVLGVIAAACSRVPPESETALDGAGGFGNTRAGDAVGNGGAIDPASSADGDLLLAGTSGVGATGAREPRVAADQRDSGGDGGSASVPGGNLGGVAQGIDYAKREIKIVFPHKAENCGDDQTTVGQGTSNQKGKDVLDLYVKFFNDEVLKPYNWKLGRQSRQRA